MSLNEEKKQELKVSMLLRIYAEHKNNISTSDEYFGFLEEQALELA